MQTAKFDSWLDEQFAVGLVDIKMSISPGRGITGQKVQDELLAAEAMVSSEAPKATSFVPTDVMNIIVGVRT